MLSLIQVSRNLFNHIRRSFLMFFK
ncbi:hypothetical protein SPV_2497 [Streptococcus pneumoniae]|nr:hypothetical protein SPV_2497 [Streptococcus pneumoniae]